MASISERLLQLKSEIDQAKLDKASLEGALNQNLKRLNDEFKCRSLEQAESKLSTLQKQKEALVQKQEKVMQELEANYSW